jgi:hypothetical protein
MNMDSISVSGVTAAETRLLDAIKFDNVAAIDQVLFQDLLFITPGGNVNKGNGPELTSFRHYDCRWWSMISVLRLLAIMPS